MIKWKKDIPVEKEHSIWKRGIPMKEEHFLWKRSILMEAERTKDKPSLAGCFG